MPRKKKFQWAENDFDLPEGVGRLGLSGDDAPVDGKKYIMYHGTSSANAAAIMAYGFRWSKDGMLGSGVYLSRDVKKASYYPNGHPKYDKVIFKVSVDVGKVSTITNMDHPRRKTWQDPRYGEVFDTAWIPPGCGLVREVVCVWDPNRIIIISILKPRPVPPGYIIPPQPVPRGYIIPCGYIIPPQCVPTGHRHGYGHGHGHRNGYGYGPQGYM